MPAWDERGADLVGAAEPQTEGRRRPAAELRDAPSADAEPVSADATSPNPAPAGTEQPETGAAATTMPTDAALPAPPTVGPASAGGDTEATQTLGAPRIGLFAGVALAALGADVLSKVLVVAELNPLQPRRLLDGAVYLVLARNGGAAFSVGPGATGLFTAIAVIVVAVLVRVASRLRSAGWAVALGLVLGGALGNLTDRLARAPGFGRGHVVDWISLFSADGHVWPIFNLADSAIVSGGALGALLAVLGIELNGRRSVPS